MRITYTKVDGERVSYAIGDGLRALCDADALAHHSDIHEVLVTDDCGRQQARYRTTFHGSVCRVTGVGSFSKGILCPCRDCADTTEFKTEKP